jgi:hypothetical protein
MSNQKVTMKAAEEVGGQKFTKKPEVVRGLKINKVLISEKAKGQ